jgi:hypothetical protein
MVASSGMTGLPQLACSKQGRLKKRRRILNAGANQQCDFSSS